MSKQRCDRVISSILRQPWAITPEGLELILGIAHRQIADHEAVLSTPLERREGSTLKMLGNVAVIPVMGSIFPRASMFTEISGATSIEALALRFGEALSADDVKAIVLHIDSPGGQITGVHEFAEQIYSARSVKPIVAYVSGMGASAAYWLATAASKIVADKTATVGSIGVIAAWTDDKDWRESMGVKDYELVSSQSPKKNLDPAKGEGRAALQRELDGLADIFITDVARNRGKQTDAVQKKFGQGGVMLAAAAKKVGMIDEIGNLEGAIASVSDGGINAVNGGFSMEAEDKFLTRLMSAFKKANAAEAKAKAAEEDDEEEDDEEEEEAKSGKGKKPAGKKKAETDKEKDDDEEKDGKASAVNKASLLARYPDLYNEIRADGALQERARIKSIEEMAAAADKTLIEAAKYTDPCSAQEFALRVVHVGERAKL